MTNLKLIKNNTSNQQLYTRILIPARDQAPIYQVRPISHLALFTLFCILSSFTQAQCTANAGSDQIYITGPITLGASPCATGGAAPYTYQWLPNTGFTGGTNNTQCSPQVAPTSSTHYTLTVTDANGVKCSASVMILNISASISYIEPKKTLDAGYQIKQNNKIYFSYEEEYVGAPSSSSLTYRIIDPTTNQNVTCNLGGGVKKLGDNRFYIDVPTCSPGLTAGKYYLVELTSVKNEKTFFKFLN